MSANPDSPPEEPTSAPQTLPDIGHGHPEYHFVQGLLAIQQSIDSVRSRIDSMSEQLGRLSAKVENIETRLGSLESKVSALEKTIIKAGSWIGGALALGALILGIYKAIESHISITFH